MKIKLIHSLFTPDCQNPEERQYVCCKVTKNNESVDVFVSEGCSLLTPED